MFKNHFRLINFFLCFSFFLPSLYARDGLPSSFNVLETNNSSEIIKFYPINGGEPIVAGGVKLLTPQQMAEVPDLIIDVNRPLLPASKNNAALKFFPNPVIDQGAYGSCAQAAGIGHHLTYIINLGRDASFSRDNKYPHNYTWNFLNGGDQNGGSSFLEGWDIVNENGIPNQTIWSDTISAYTKWMTGYNNYYNSMKNRYVEYKKIDISTPQGIETLKQWIQDFGDGSPYGGLGSFSVNCVQPLWNTTLPKVPSGAVQGWPIVNAWGAKGGHVMTIVGWHDSACIDVDGKNGITNDRDINNDGKVDVKDWEKGAWLIANTWGAKWGGKNGFFYMLYRTGALEIGDAYNDTNDIGTGVVKDFNKGGLTTNKHAFTLRFRNSTDKAKQAFTYKISMTHNQRDKISISFGVANNTSATSPEYSQRCGIFNYQGGAWPMQGKNGSQTIEIGIDAKHLLNYADQKSAKFFLMIDSKGGTGSVASFALEDYRGASPVEKPCTETNKTITANATTVMSIVYDNMPDPLAITTASIPGGTKNTPYTTTLQASGGTTPYKWEALKNVYYDVTAGSETWQITTTVTPNDTDDGFAEKTLPFTFPFYGKNYTKIFIATDGNIQFDSTYTYVRSKKALMAIKSIAGLGADLVYQSGDKMYYTADATKAVIRWQTKHMWSATGILTVNLDFACVLYPSEKVEYYYGTLSGDVTGMAIGASGGEGAYYAKDYGAVTDIPANYKFAILPEKEVTGLAMNGSSGVYSGTPTNDNGDYHVTFAVSDALEVKKTKSFTLTIGPAGISNGNMQNILAPVKIINGANAINFCFETSKALNASLEIFALNGQKIATVFSGKLAQGEQKIVWNLENGKELSNGIYLCKLAVGNEKMVKRVALFR